MITAASVVLIIFSDVFLGKSAYCPETTSRIVMVTNTATSTYFKIRSPPKRNTPTHYFSSGSSCVWVKSSQVRGVRTVKVRRDSLLSEC